MGCRRLHCAIAVLSLAASAAQQAHAIDTRKPDHPARVWFVDNTAAGNGDGSMVAPFDRLGRAERAADLGDTIYVFRGDGTARGLDEGIRLRPYQRLIGSGVTFAVDGEEALPAGERPLLAAARGPAVVLAPGTRVEGLALSAVDGPALVGDDVGGVVLSTLSVDGAVDLREPRGDLRIESSDLVARAGPALLVESTSGVARIEVAALTLSGQGADAGAGAASGASSGGLQVRASGDAALVVAVASTVLEEVIGHGFAFTVEGSALLQVELTGSGPGGALSSRPTTTVVGEARGNGRMEIAARGNDLVGRETGVLLTAHDRGKLRAELVANAVGDAGMARGAVLLLGDGAEGTFSLTRNHIAGQSAEAVYALAASRSQLGLAVRDNDLASGTGRGAAPYPALAVETRDESRGCLVLAENRFADEDGAGPAVALRQHGESLLAVSGHEPATLAGAGHATERLGASNRLTRVVVEGERALAAPAGLPCPAPPPSLAAAP